MPTQSPPAVRPLRVLAVDDNLDVSRILAALLRRRGYEVRSRGDGPAALHEAAAFRPEAAVLDLGLPGMDGWELAGRLRVPAPAARPPGIRTTVAGRHRAGPAGPRTLLRGGHREESTRRCGGGRPGVVARPAPVC